MSFSFLPVEKRVGVWQIKWVSLIIWVLVINLLALASIYLGGNKPLRTLRHPSTVKVDSAILYTQAGTGSTSHVQAEAKAGEIVELQSIQPDGWCYVTIPSSRMSGYVRQESLQIPDSTHKALQQKLLSKQSALFYYGVGLAQRNLYRFFRIKCPPVERPAQITLVAQYCLDANAEVHNFWQATLTNAAAHRNIFRNHASRPAPAPIATG